MRDRLMTTVIGGLGVALIWVLFWAFLATELE